MVITERQPSGKALPKLLEAFGFKGAIKFFLVALMRPLYLSVEVGRFDDDVLDIILMSGWGKASVQRP